MELKFKKLCAGAFTPAYAHKGDACFDLRVLVDEGENRPQMYFGDTVRNCSSYRFGDQCESDKPSVMVYKNEALVFRTGLAFEIPPGHVMLVFMRSSAGIKRNLVLTNGTGVIDSGYRGEIHVAVRNAGGATAYIKNGDRIAQAMIVPYPVVDLVETDQLSDSERGAGGIGSTGN